MMIQFIVIVVGTDLTIFYELICLVRQIPYKHFG
jgi:hypothetical protein